jgi:hypothetical protein
LALLDQFDLLQGQWAREESSLSSFSQRLVSHVSFECGRAWSRSWDFFLDTLRVHRLVPR